MSSLIKRILRKLKRNYSSTQFDNHEDYIKGQHRCEPKEFMDHRIKIVSSFTYILPKLEELGVSDRQLLKEGKAAGQLENNQISILDAGSRDGWVVQFLNSLGYPNTMGVELLTDYVNYAKSQGRNVIEGDLHKLPLENEQFDFVYSRHTLEHCLDPVKVLSQLLRVLKKEGVLYCSFPLVAEPHGKHTLAISNVTTIYKILEKLEYSFDVIFIGNTKETSILPEGDEVIIFIRKK
jgi:SAM-dependent methyltransferase